MVMTESDLKTRIRDIPDFPKKGIIFKDITTLLKDKDAFGKSIDLLAEKFESQNIDYVVGAEARGFIFGAPLAYRLGAGFIPVRKKGKLPSKTRSVTYELEYGTDQLEMHDDALHENARVLIVDDLLATGGTARAVIELVKNQNVELAGVAFVVELTFLGGLDKLKDVLGDCPVYSVLKY